jgi:glycerate 2-kinase
LKLSIPGIPIPQWIDYRRHLRSIARAAIEAVDPYDAVTHHLKLNGDELVIGEYEYYLEEGTRIFVVGAGKAGITMARAVEDILGERIWAGVVSVPDLPSVSLQTIKLISGGHPLPTEGSIEAGKQIRDLLADVCEKDLVLVLISGGGSALLELPKDGLQLSDLQKVNDLLLKSGAPIQDVNIVRRQLSMIKGGGLARLAAPANIFTLILSDVIGDQLESIASGPTIPGPSNVMDVYERYKLHSRIPGNVIRILEDTKGIEISKSSDGVAEIENIIIGSNTIAAQAAVDKARELGFQALLITTLLQGEAREVGKLIAALIKAVKILPSNPICMVLGGETTVTVKGNGVGGRNQELALSTAMELEGVSEVAMMTLATDGIDGPTPSAGAIVDGQTISKALSLDLDAYSFLENNDSHTFFHALGDTVSLGPTGTNVNDLTICLVYKP